MNDFERALRFLGAVVGGLGLGVGLTYAAWFLVLGGATVFGGIHPQSGHVEFGLSIGQDIYFLCLALGTVIGTIALLRRKMALELRVLCICAALPLLGFFALCSMFSLNDLFATPHV